MKSFKPHDTKQIIRSQWCRPLIAQLGNKLTYLGLPAKEALDISDWLPHLNNIIAFQCKDHRQDGIESWEDAKHLESILLSLERQEKSNFSLYKGYLEEVVLGGRDTITGTPFNIHSPVNIYNLDFCNDLTSPITYFDKLNNPQKAFKLDAIGKLLEIQRDIEVNKTKRFIMFMTVHSGINEKSLKMHTAELSSGEYSQYYSAAMKLSGAEKSIRLIKLAIFNFIRTHFCSRCFTPELLPPIYYQGTGGHRLLTFTILGESEKTSSGTAAMYQASKTFLNSKLISADSSGLSLHSLVGVNEKNISLDPIYHFKASNFYKRFIGE